LAKIDGDISDQQGGSPPHGCSTYMIQVDPVNDEATVDDEATKAACILPVTSNNINTTYIEQVPSEL